MSQVLSQPAGKLRTAAAISFIMSSRTYYFIDKEAGAAGHTCLASMVSYSCFNSLQHDWPAAQSTGSVSITDIVLLPGPIGYVRCIYPAPSATMLFSWYAFSTLFVLSTAMPVPKGGGGGGRGASSGFRSSPRPALGSSPKPAFVPGPNTGSRGRPISFSPPKVPAALRPSVSRPKGGSRGGAVRPGKALSRKWFRGMGMDADTNIQSSWSCNPRRYRRHAYRNRQTPPTRTRKTPPLARQDKCPRRAPRLPVPIGRRALLHAPRSPR